MADQINKKITILTVSNCAKKWKRNKFLSLNFLYMTLLLELYYAARGPQTVARLIFGLRAPALEYITNKLMLIFPP